MGPGRSELERLIESVALELVVGSAVSDRADRIGEMLSALADQARAAGFSSLTEAVEEMQGALRPSETQDWDDVERKLKDGIARLRQALEQSEAAPKTTSQNQLAEDPELIADFVLESQEHLVSIESQLLILEQDPGNAEAIHSVFRSFHTIKGLAGFLELTEIRDVAHELETVLDLARSGQLTITPAVIDVALACADFLKQWVERLQAPSGERHLIAVPPSAPLIQQILALRSKDPVAAQAPEAAAANGTVAPVEVREQAEAERRRARTGEARMVKVDTGKLDLLVDMVGEMVIAQSLVRHDPDLAQLRTPRLLRNLAQLSRTTTELQKTAMSMRMVPVGQLFQKMARLTRDLARKSGKQAQLETIGEETELDRNLVEEIADPLMHMVRNSVDHGIEPPEERIAAGKPPVGRILLKASHQAGHIVIELSDDGRGLNKQKILAKAREKGLLDGGVPETDSEIYNLIFQPGFSTADRVTDVSGRGVGMDVVRKQIQKLRGRIDIRSQEGQGATFSFKLPLTLAIIDGLVVRVGKERYIVPLYSVREVLRPGPDTISTVENRAEMALIRDHLLPVIRLYERFNVEPLSKDPCQCVLIVVEINGKAFGLLVDELSGKQEVVIKSLGETMKDIPGIAGGAILGDGRVGLVLDVVGIVGSHWEVAANA
ncbi:MAG: chemotaxis protein CheW [Bryobacteraceae bacterium]|nr:chemotaxis protein CheW [Bryobacteraceae bacterium]